eukprot:6353856-Ditylum_brightwellii.AAC.1
MQQSMNCCCVQINSPLSTLAMKHLVAHLYLQNCSNAHLGVLATRCQDAENSESNQGANTIAKQAMCIDIAITSNI